MKFHKAMTPWNKGLTGIYTKEHRKKLRDAHAGIPQTKEHKDKIAATQKNRILRQRIFNTLTAATQKKNRILRTIFGTMTSPICPNERFEYQAT